MNRYIALALTLLVTVACTRQLGTGVAAGEKKVVHATVFLLPVGGFGGVGTTCVIRTIPTTVEVRKNEEILWSTVDACHATAAEITIAFADNPLDPACNLTGKKVRCKVKPEATEGPKKYTVASTGAQTEDPELEIVM